MIGLAADYNDTPTANNTTYPARFPVRLAAGDRCASTTGRATAHSFYLRYLHDNYDLIEPRGTFIGAAMPTIPTNRVRPGYGYQLAHTGSSARTCSTRSRLNGVVERPADSAGR